MKPRVVVAPDFRSMEEIFADPTLERLHDATPVVFGNWHESSDTPRRAGASLRHVFEVAGGHSNRDLDYATCFDRGITVASCAPASGPAVAAMAVALGLAAARLVVEGDTARGTRAHPDAERHTRLDRASPRVKGLLRGWRERSNERWAGESRVRW